MTTIYKLPCDSTEMYSYSLVRRLSCNGPKDNTLRNKTVPHPALVPDFVAVEISVLLRLFLQLGALICILPSLI